MQQTPKYKKLINKNNDRLNELVREFFIIMVGLRRYFLLQLNYSFINKYYSILLLEFSLKNFKKF